MLAYHIFKTTKFATWSDITIIIITKQCYSIIIGSDYRYACPDAIQIKGSVCHSNCVHRIMSRLCVMATMPMVFGSNLTLPTFTLFFFFTFFQA